MLIFSRLLGGRIRVAITILGVVGDRMVRWHGTVRLRAPADVRAVLRAAGVAAGVDLCAAVGAGPGPNLLLDGHRLELPTGLDAPVVDGANLAWLAPLSGG